MVVTWNSALFRKRIHDAAFRGIVAGGELVREEAVSLILSTAKTGRTYQRRGVVHRASAPGEPPASDTGRLVNSLRVETNYDQLSATVISGAAYGEFLEFGTQTIEPRPFLRPALANKRKDVMQLISDEIRKVLS